jgi:hypothetical protein
MRKQLVPHTIAASSPCYRSSALQANICSAASLEKWKARFQHALGNNDYFLRLPKPDWF